MNLDSAEDREALRALPARLWSRSVGPTVLDEAQTEPSIFEKLELAFDDRSLDVSFSVLLWSAQVLLLQNVREDSLPRSRALLLPQPAPRLVRRHLRRRAHQRPVRRPLLEHPVSPPVRVIRASSTHLVYALRPAPGRQNGGGIQR